MQSHELLVNDFQIGMKLEARDPKNNSSWCLATVIGIEGLRVKLRFDGGGNTNDFYELIDSDSIRPYGSKPDEVLRPPISFEGNLMSYPRYVDKVLSKDEAIVAPAHCFLPTPKKPPTNLFKVGMKLEAIDKKNPFLICPATIGEVKGEDVKILFDGWRGSFDYVCKYYSRDIFPINWCRDNNYYLTPPHGWEHIVAAAAVNQAKKEISADQKEPKGPTEESLLGDPSVQTDTSVADLELEFPDISSQLESSIDELDIYPDEIKYQCSRVIPYDLWPRRKIEVERFIATNASLSIPPNSSTSHQQESSSSNNSLTVNSQHETMSKPASIKRRGRPPKKPRLDEEIKSSPQYPLKPVPAVRSDPTAAKLKPFHDEGASDQDSDAEVPAHESWTVSEVIEFIKAQEPELEKYTQAFVDHEITGAAFASLIPDMMIRHMGLKLGPALRVARLIERLRRRD